MRTETYHTEYGEIIVEECTRREFVELAQGLVNEARFWDGAHGYAELDMTMTIHYADGTLCTYHDRFGIEGRFRRTGIVYGEISNPATYQVFGEYEVNEDGIVEAV